jgi:hypothetical protein
MKNFLVFLKERFPIVPNTIMILGLILSVLALQGEKIADHIATLSVAYFMLMIFIAELRFMDELKDYQKDLLAHPERPLPRGLISTQFLNKVINFTFVFMLFLSALVYLKKPCAALYYLITTLWLGLMYKEFFIGKSLNKSPILYAISHQVVILPALFYLFHLFGTNEKYQLNEDAYGYGLIILGSFFSYEVGRKLDPNAHKVLKTYLHEYGLNKVILMVAVLLSMTVIGACLLDVVYYVLIPALLTFLTVFLVKKKPNKFKDAEGLIALNLIYNCWFLFIRSFFL